MVVETIIPVLFKSLLEELTAEILPGMRYWWFWCTIFPGTAIPMAFLRSSSHNCPYPAGHGDNVGLYQALAVANPSIQSRTGDITRRWVQECTGFPHQRSKILANPLTSISPWFNWKPLTFFEVLVISVNSEPVSRRPFPKAWSFAFPWGTVPKKKYFKSLL